MRERSPGAEWQASLLGCNNAHFPLLPSACAILILATVLCAVVPQGAAGKSGLSEGLGDAHTHLTYWGEDAHVFDVQMELTRRLHKAGITLLAGSDFADRDYDVVPGRSLHLALGMVIAVSALFAALRH